MLVGCAMLMVAWLNLFNVDEQPTPILLSFAGLGIALLVGGVAILFRVKKPKDSSMPPAL